MYMTVVMACIVGAVANDTNCAHFIDKSGFVETEEQCAVRAEEIAESLLPQMVGFPLVSFSYSCASSEEIYKMVDPDFFEQDI